MKGMFEEYGTFMVTGIIALIILSFIVTSTISPTGEIHQLIVSNLENGGVSTRVIVDEWDCGEIKATLKDDGGLYLTGSGTLPNYADVNSAPWADKARHIVFVEVGEGVVVNGDVPIE